MSSMMKETMDEKDNSSSYSRIYTVEVALRVCRSNYSRELLRALN